MPPQRHSDSQNRSGENLCRGVSQKLLKALFRSAEIRFYERIDNLVQNRRLLTRGAAHSRGVECELGIPPEPTRRSKFTLRSFIRTIIIFITCAINHDISAVMSAEFEISSFKPVIYFSPVFL